VGIGIDGIRDSIAAALVNATQGKPNLRDIRVDMDGTQICNESVLVDLEVIYGERTSKGGILNHAGVHEGVEGYRSWSKKEVSD